MISLLFGALALAGYGDAQDGYPSWLERDLHLWTNAARVDPEAFEEDYNIGSNGVGCSFYEDFSVDEQTPKAPVMWSVPLSEAARFHSQDMFDNDWFAHESSDGTSFADRVARFYDGYAYGENIALGYSTPYDAVFQGWMCSTHGHRANIMDGGWEELGTGVVGLYYTQEFGANNIEFRRIASGVHEPEVPSGEAVFWASYHHPNGVAPDKYYAVLDGKKVDLSLHYGVEAQGIYSGTAEVEEGCHSYFFEVKVDGVFERYPEEGSFGWGDCEYEDENAGYISKQKGGGCSSVGGIGASWGLLLGASAALRRRKKL